MDLHDDKDGNGMGFKEAFDLVDDLTKKILNVIDDHQKEHDLEVGTAVYVGSSAIAHAATVVLLGRLADMSEADRLIAGFELVFNDTCEAFKEYKAGKEKEDKEDESGSEWPTS